MSNGNEERIEMPTAVYTHDEKGHREDVHRPSAINPGDYEYQHVFVNRKDKITGGPAGTCHHCGKAIVWEVVWKHLPSGNLVTFGETCTHILGMSNGRIEHEMVLLKRQAENERKALMREMEKSDRVAKFNAMHPDVAEFLNNLDETEQFSFLVSMKQSLEQWGSLTVNQVDAVRRTMKSREKYYERKIAEALTEVEPTTDIVEGRVKMSGKILSHRWQESDFGSVHKMKVKLSDNNKVWGTVPRNIDSGDDLRGKMVEFTATVTMSKDDPHFGFFSRPSNAKISD